MKKTYILLSALFISTGLYLSPGLIQANDDVKPFDDDVVVSETDSTNTSDTAKISVEESSDKKSGNEKVIAVDPGVYDYEDWLKKGIATNTAKVASDTDKVGTDTAKVATDTKKVATDTAKVASGTKKVEEQKTSQYTVVPGDCLSKIAQEKLGDYSRWPELVELNKDKYPSLLSNPNLIYSGWDLKIPAPGSSSSSSSSGKIASSPTTGSSNTITNGQAVDASGWGSASPCNPMPSYISSEYGPRDLFGSSFHNGIDVPVPSGTRVNAMANGTVTAVGFEPGGGNYVRVKYDNGYETFYCHLQSQTVKVGQRVQAGQQVAVSDNTGQYTTGAHLHMEVRVNGNRVDPRSVYNGFPAKR